MKKLITIMCCLLLVVTCLSCVACNKEPAKEQKQVATTYVTMDINPSIELVVDQNNKVMKVYAANEDAEVMLYQEEGLINCDISVASEKILDLAVEYGYLTEENKGVELSVVADKAEDQEEVEQKLHASIEAKSDKLSFDINIAVDVDFGIQRKLNEYKEKYPELTSAKLKLILSAMACDSSLTFDAAYDMTTEELLQVVQSKRDAINAYCDEAYKKAVEAYEFAYAQTVDIARTGAEMLEAGKIMLANPMKYISVAKKATDYVTFLTSSYALKGIVIAQDAIGSIAISEEVAQNIATKLGVEVDVLQDEEGKCTIESVEAYISKVAKNAVGEEKAALEAKYADIMTQLNTAETEYAESEQYLKAAVVNDVQKALEAIETMAAEFEVTIPDLTNPTKEDLEKLSADFAVKADEAYNEILASFTEDELAQIKKAGDDAVVKLDAKKAELDKKIADEKAKVEAKIAAKKEARKQA